MFTVPVVKSQNWIGLEISGDFVFGILSGPVKDPVGNWHDVTVGNTWY